MLKTLFFILLIFGIGGCGRTAGVDSGVSTKSNGKLQFVTVEKSHFVAGNYPGSGHYMTIVKTLNKPEIYAQHDLLEECADTDNGKTHNYMLLENNKHKEESTVCVKKSNNEVESDIMLLLDLSGSIVEQKKSLEDLIKASLTFIDQILKNGNFKIAVYYFNAKREITPLNRQTEYPTSNLEILHEAINQLRDQTFIQQYLWGYTNSTNLYGAVKESSEKVCTWVECDAKDNHNDFKMGSIVIFTDGRDLADIVSKKEMLKSLKETLQYYTIGIGDADKETLKEISGKSRFFEEEEDIESAFRKAYNYILYNSSFYRIKYCPSTREGTIRIKILFHDQEHNIKAYTEEEKITIENSDLRCDI